MYEQKDPCVWVASGNDSMQAICLTSNKDWLQ